ncbi:zinc-dependent metalloprotease family protein (plasmid) [Streptomyces sp. BI20]|uniref:zinc-dependent metalloprotease family protein n=1 Tax=Streptomyces sp. BI20 TaxID=3403460 RepID=UPI003C74CBB5
MPHVFRHVALAGVLAATALPSAAVADTPRPPEPAARQVVLAHGQLKLRAADFAAHCLPGTRRASALRLPLAMELRRTEGEPRVHGTSLTVTGEVAPAVGARPGTLTWVGRVADVPGSSSHLTVEGACTPDPADDEVRGFVLTPGHKYLIGTDAEDRARTGVVDVDPDAVPAPAPAPLDLPRVIPPLPDRPRSVPPVAKPGARAVIDVAVGYTRGALRGLATGEGSGTPSRYWRPRRVEDEIRTTVDRMNEALAVSGVNAEVRLVRTFAVPASAGVEDAGAVLEQMDRGTGTIGRLARRVREESGADLVSVWTNVTKGSGTYTAGQGDLPTNPDGSFRAPAARDTEQSAFSSIDVFAAIDGEPGFAHELGHNLGLMHDERTMRDQLEEVARENGMSVEELRERLNIPPLPGGQGYITPDARFFTTMAYKITCEPYAERIGAPEPTCQYTNTYSNPRLTADGTALGEEGSADAAHALDLTVGEVSAYRASRT